MNIDEAIEVKEAYHEKFRKHMLTKERDADQLSIEALKREKANREDPKYVMVGTLPGEDAD